MISLSMFVCVLALVVAASAAAASIISWRRTLELQRWRSTMQHNSRNFAQQLATLNALVSALKSTAPNALAAEVADLREAVAKLAATQRRFAGRFDATRHHEAVANGDTAANGALDPELAAELALQTAPASGPR